MFILSHLYITDLNEQPTIPKLLDLKISLLVSDKYELFGITLLNDKDGNRMDMIKDECRGIPDKITTKILKIWMEGDGMAVTWQSISIALRQCHSLSASCLAHQIDITLKNM